jgi:hypothetical protein
MVTMTVKLPKTTSARISAVAKARRVPKSQVVREVLESHFKSKGKGRRVMFYEMAWDIIGSVKGGPPDLSSNPKYMEGYGE